MEHTPWTYDSGFNYFTIYDVSGNEVLTVDNKNPHLLKSIVQAVNLHNELVTLAKAVISNLVGPTRTTEGSGPIRSQ